MELQNLDHWLDGALAELGETEPRRGLESRVLANLRAEQTRMRVRRFWGALAAAAGAVVILVVWLGGLGVHNQQARLTAANGDRPPIASTVPIPIQHDTPSLANRRPSHKRRTQAAQRKAVQEESTPRLDQFPSIRHLSPQEEMLMTYLREAPTTEIIAVEKQAHEISDLQINDIVVPALDSENATSRSSQTR